uniref:Peptidase S8 pro-domain domain-containing protein n=1 Tax=Romanomermis culicivorax TaxID=13658 RepID=A0A915JTQ1_ROMCU
MIVAVLFFGSTEPKTYTNLWSVEVKSGVNIKLLNKLAIKHGFENKGPVFDNVYLFALPAMKQRSKRKTFHVYRVINDLIKENPCKLNAHQGWFLEADENFVSGVIRVTQQTAHKRYSRRATIGNCKKSNHRVKRSVSRSFMKPNDPMFDQMWYIVSIKLLNGELTDVLEAASLSYNRQFIDIYSNSWGPDDGGSSFSPPKPLTIRAFIE